jgi:serine phosphatase RsbU (regulator of sigma subunit)
MATANSMPGTASSVPKLTLEAISGPPLAAVTPPPEKSTVLGRSSQSDVVLGDEAVSRRHCALSAHQGTWFIEDLGSRHGTYVQSVKLGQGERTPLKHGDVVGVGPWMLRARIGAGFASTAGARVVTLMGGGGSTANAGSPGGQAGSTLMRERVERVAERELAEVNRNRLKLLMEVAAAVAGTGSEDELARQIISAAAQGTGFIRAFLLRDETPGATEASAGAEVLSVVAEIDPEAAAAKDGDPAERESGVTFSRSLIAAARKGEIVRLTSDAPMQGQSIVSLGIQAALCVPIMAGGGVAAYLYLDSRTGEKPGGKTRGAVSSLSGNGGTVHSDAAAFCSALAKMYGLALGNISRLELERRQKELVRDLEAASEAQRLIMPPTSGQFLCANAAGESAGLGVKYAMRNKSGRYVAGDLFDAFELGDGRAGILLGDVAGKGIPAALLMATAQTHLHVSLREWKDPARVVRAVNRHICEHMASNKFISLWLGLFQPRAGGGGTLSYVDSGHGYWLLIGPTGQTVVRNTSATAIPLGIDPAYDFEAVQLEIPPDHRLVVFSDGVVEQPAGERDGSSPREMSLSMFGVEGAVAALQGSTSVADDVDRVFNAVLAHASGPNLADDTTVASIAM